MTTNRQPQPGDFGLTKIPGAAGKLIDLGETLNGDGFSTWSHAFIVVSCPPDTVQIVEAEPGGARWVADSKYADVVYSSWDLTDDQRQKIVAAAYGAIGRPYSAADYFAIAAHRLHLPLPGLRSYVQASGHQICSQLVDWCYQQAGVQLFNDGRWNGYVTPQGLNHVRTGGCGPACPCDNREDRVT
jgi:hypothetical protein